MTTLNFLKFSQLNLTAAIAAIAGCGYMLDVRQAVAQTVLPGLIVEGATLEVPPVRATPAIPAATVAPKPKTAPKAVPQVTAKPKPASADVASAAPPPTAVVSPVVGPAASVAASPAPVGEYAADASSAAGVPVRQIGTAVTVISGTDIERSQAASLVDVLRGQPGVTVAQSGSAGSLTSVRLRGEDSKYTRVVVDGIDASTTKDGGFDFSMLSADNIERVEIIRGPMSALYGSGALGGVINVVTRTPRGPWSGVVRVEGGSFGTKDIAARAGSGGDSGYLSVFGQMRDIAGFNISPAGTERDGTRLLTVGGKAGVALSPDAKLEFVLRHTEKRAAYDDFGADFVSSAAVKPYYTADDAANVLRQRQTLAGVKLSWDSFGGSLTQVLKANYNNDLSRNRYESLPGTPFFFPPVSVNNSRDESARFVYGYNATYRVPGEGFGKHTVSGLVERETEQFTPFSDFSTVFGDYNGDGVRRERNRLSFAGEWRGVFADRLALTAGVRRDDNDSFQDFTTWRTSASYDWKELGLRPHASMGTGVKLPGMFDQFGANSTTYQSNPDLKPERSLGYDVGLEQRFLGGRLVLDTTYFNTRLEDRIALSGFDLTTFRSFPINVGGVSRRQGVEVAANYLINRSWSIGLAYTYTDAETPTGDKEFRRTPHGARANVRYTFDGGRGTADIIALYNSRTPDVAFVNPTFARSTVQLDSVFLLQLAASYKLTQNVEVYGRLENVLGQKYQEVYGYNAAGFGAYGGLKFKFGAEATATKP